MFKCKDLMNLTSMSKASLIAGEKGLSNVIRWVYKAENLDFFNWIKGGELLIISSSLINSPGFNLSELIENAIKYNMSGALMLVGPDFIRKISRNTLRLADREGFPLFTIPWNVPLVDVFIEIGHNIVYQENLENNNNNILSRIIYGEKINPEVLISESEKIGYDINPPQQIFTIYSAEGIMIDIDDKLLENIKKLFKEYELKTFLYCYGNNIVGIVRANDERVNSAYEKAAEYLNSLYNTSKIFVAVGRVCTEIEELHQSYTDCSKCISLPDDIIPLRGNVVYYEKLGFYRLLFCFDNKSPLEDFVNYVLGGILDYDRKNNTELVDTLSVYLKNNCIITNTAKALFTHKNTVKYRIQRIEEITGRSLSDPYSKNELYNAVIIREFLRNR
ncbi:MAG: PucR family transcriptional regulator ligand-binding domain-containing protein [Clostridiales bacterium]|nr:PucR family transcriptional regulator ligand-binding domain-containing protein [Clostridiales bacterium]